MAEAFDPNDPAEVAAREVAAAIPSELRAMTKIRLDDVERLMVLAWLRGATWQRHRLKPVK